MFSRGPQGAGRGPITPGWPAGRHIVLCVDEKSQIQALDREQPVLPMAPNAKPTHTFATGAVIGKCYKRHRANAVLDFVKKIEKIDAAMPDGPEVHLAMDDQVDFEQMAISPTICPQTFSANDVVSAGFRTASTSSSMTAARPSI